MNPQRDTENERTRSSSQLTMAESGGESQEKEEGEVRIYAEKSVTYGRRQRYKCRTDG